MKRLYIMQGIPGSSKSTVAKVFQIGFNSEGKSCTIRSTDDQFMVDGIYVFNRDKIYQHHKTNQRLVQTDMETGIDVIIVDNTNIKAKEAGNYINMANTYGYSVTVLTVNAGLNESLKRNAERTVDKQVPEDIIRRMHSSMEKIL